MSKLSYLDRIKLLMMFVMTLGHVGWAFVPTDTLLSQLLHFCARMTVVLACFLVVEGFYKTHNLKAYLKRLFGFALIAQLPYTLYAWGFEEVGLLPMRFMEHGNVLFGLGFALCVLICLQNSEAGKALPNQRSPNDAIVLLSWLPKIAKNIVLGFCIVGLSVLSLWSDWGIAVVLWVLAYFYGGVYGFGILSVLFFGLSIIMGHKALGDNVFLPINASQLMDYGVLLAVPVVAWYHKYQHRSPMGYRLPRLLFYWYYALHLLVLAVLGIWIS